MWMPVAIYSLRFISTLLIQTERWTKNHKSESGRHESMKVQIQWKPIESWLGQIQMVSESTMPMESVRMWNWGHKQERFHEGGTSPWLGNLDESVSECSFYKSGPKKTRHSYVDSLYAWPFSRLAFICIVIFTNQLENSKWNVPYWVHSYWFPCCQAVGNNRKSETYNHARTYFIESVSRLQVNDFLFQALKSFQCLLVCDTCQNRFQPHICGITWASKSLFTSLLRILRCVWTRTLAIVCMSARFNGHKHLHARKCV